MNRRWEFSSCFTSHLPQRWKSIFSFSQPSILHRSFYRFRITDSDHFSLAALFSVDKLNERGNLIRSLSLFSPTALSFPRENSRRKFVRNGAKRAVYEKRNNRLRAFDYRELIEADLSSDPTSAGKLARRCYDAHGSTFRELEFDEAVPIFAKFDTHRLHADFLA